MAAMLAGSQQRLQRRDQMRQKIRRVSFGTVAAAALLLILLVVPFSYTINLGSVVTIENIPLNENYSAFARELSAIPGLINHAVRRQGDTVSLQLGFNREASESAESKIRQLLADHELNHSALALSSRNIVKTVGGNALAAITGGNIRINAAGMDDDELEAALMSELAAAGLSGSEVNIATDADGNKHIEFSFERPADLPDDQTEYRIEITFDEEGDLEVETGGN
jgi:hypothetical protein